jgi:hypothetical protein
MEDAEYADERRRMQGIIRVHPRIPCIPRPFGTKRSEQIHRDIRKTRYFCLTAAVRQLTFPERQLYLEDENGRTRKNQE